VVARGSRDTVGQTRVCGGQVSAVDQAQVFHALGLEGKQPIAPETADARVEQLFPALAVHGRPESQKRGVVPDGLERFLTDVAKDGFL
jgi:hypothetical protein